MKKIIDSFLRTALVLGIVSMLAIFADMLDEYFAFDPSYHVMCRMTGTISAASGIFMLMLSLLMIVKKDEKSRNL